MSRIDLTIKEERQLVYYSLNGISELDLSRFIGNNDGKKTSFFTPEHDELYYHDRKIGLGLLRLPQHCCKMPTYQWPCPSSQTLAE